MDGYTQGYICVNWSSWLCSILFSLPNTLLLRTNDFGTKSARHGFIGHSNVYGNFPGQIGLNRQRTERESPGIPSSNQQSGTRRDHDFGAGEGK